MNTPKKILEEAKTIDKQYDTLVTLNEDLPKKGIPIVVKDNICTQGLRTTAGSEILHDYIPVFDATVIKRLKDAGFYVVGKAAQDEFGFGTFSTNCFFKVPKNPNDIERSCGGSSGGTAAYIKASKLVNYGLGQSTGGSISCPAAFCGVVGLTPTYGLVSRYGLIDYANSFDKIGPITKTVKQSAEILNIISGYDSNDQTSVQRDKEDYTSYCGQDISKMKIGVVKEFFSEDIDKRIRDNVWVAIKKLESLGAKYEEVSIPLQDYVVPTYYILATAEASTNLAKYCGLRYGMSSDLEGYYDDYFSTVREMGFGKEAKRRILLGTFIRMVGYRDAYYIKAMKLRTKIIKEYKKLFKKFDVLVGPTMPVLPPRFTDIEKLSPVENYMMDILTIPSNLAGMPSLSVPVDEVDNLPVGMQFMADHFEEKKLIMLGDAYEQG
ncbi:MAG: Asp-tRNA(Asn)/Glu-tRNA(Gln) amidotransferase subunit GatA [Nanoarchaeota archaeon]|nr:Asp-tRNA(Asn)/Glu-tRNA(Gln) amidotransferase subunit GatA [Nanoarchaeota archaeon]